MVGGRFLFVSEKIVGLENKIVRLVKIRSLIFLVLSSSSLTRTYIFFCPSFRRPVLFPCPFFSQTFFRTIHPFPSHYFAPRPHFALIPSRIPTPHFALIFSRIPTPFCFLFAAAAAGGAHFDHLGQRDAVQRRLSVSAHAVALFRVGCVCVCLCWGSA